MLIETTTSVKSCLKCAYEFRPLEDEFSSKQQFSIQKKKPFFCHLLILHTHTLPVPGTCNWNMDHIICLGVFFLPKIGTLLVWCSGFYFCSTTQRGVSVLLPMLLVYWLVHRIKETNLLIAAMQMQYSLVESKIAKIGKKKLSSSVADWNGIAVVKYKIHGWCHCGNAVLFFVSISVFIQADNSIGGSIHNRPLKHTECSPDRPQGISLLS